MLFCKLDESGNPISYAIDWENIKNLRPNVSLPFPPTAELLAELGFGILEEGERPDNTNPRQRVHEVLPKKVGDKFIKQYELRDMEGTELEFVENRAWRMLRLRRNDLLRSTDRYMLADVQENMTEEQINNWKDYRQALRDLPDTVEDPFNFTWPTRPTA